MRWAIVVLLMGCAGLPEVSEVDRARASDPVRPPPPRAPARPTVDCGTAHACFQRSKVLAGQEQLTQQARGALAALGRSCELGYAGGCFALGQWARAGANAEARQLCARHDCLNAAERLWEAGCQGGPRFGAEGSMAPGPACLGLAALHHAVHRDDRRAAQLARRACALRSGRGCRYAADLIEEGVAQPKDPRELTTLRERAEEFGWQSEPEELWP
jgi:hypothetical protein